MLISPTRFVVVESGLGRESGLKSIFAGLGLRRGTAGLGPGLELDLAVAGVDTSLSPTLHRGHPYILYKPRTYNTVRASYFSIRIVNV